MTTQAWTTTLSNISDATFRASGSDLSAKLAAVGLVQTADTGQINWTTVTRPGSPSTQAGYEIWRFNDSLQSTAPIYIRIGYGSSSGGVNSLGLWFSVGTGTDGAGTLTGTALATARSASGSSLGSGSYTSYLCYKDGFFGLVWGANAATCSMAAFALSRTCDGAGAWTSTGAVCYWAATGSRTAQPTVQSLRFATTAATYTAASGGFCIAPHGLNSQINGDNPIHLHWMPVPETVPVLGLCTHVTAQYSLGSFTATLIGSTARTYFTTGATVTSFGYGTDNGTTGFCIAMLWE